jgi:hypothetical protein
MVVLVGVLTFVPLDFPTQKSFLSGLGSSTGSSFSQLGTICPMAQAETCSLLNRAETDRK